MVKTLSIKPIKSLTLLVMSVLLLCATFYAHAKVEIILDKMSMELGEQIQMLINSDQSGELDAHSLQILQQFFQINGNSKQQQIQIINGKRSVNNSTILLLTAATVGTHTIPSLKIGNETSQPFQVTIKPIQTTSQNTGGQPADFLLIGKVDHSDPYVKSEVIYSLKLMYVHRILSGQVSRLTIGNLPIKTITKEKRYQTSYQGKAYNVIEWRFAFIPRVSGDISVQQLTFQGHVQTPAGRKSIRLATQPITLKVKSQPAQWTQIKTDWLPAKSLNVWEKWQPSVSQWEVGKRYRREIKLDAEGVEAKQIANLHINHQANNYSVYPKQPTRKEEINEKGHQGQYSHQIDYVPNQAGIITLPEIKIPWWDTLKDQLRYAILPARQINVLPNKNATPAQKNTSPTVITKVIGIPDNDSIHPPIHPNAAINDLDPKMLAKIQATLHQPITLKSLVKLPLATQLLLITGLLTYSLLILLIGLWIGKKSTSRHPTTLKQSPDSLPEAITQLRQIIKKRKTREFYIIYQMMLRCYTRHQHKLPLECKPQWLNQIEQLHKITQELPTSSKQQFDFVTLDDLLKSTLQQQKTQNQSPLPSLYPST